MAKQLVNIGSTADDGTGDPLRTAFNKINSNFNELYSPENCTCFQIGDMIYSANVAPASGTWLLANGQAVLKSTYADLYSLVGQSNFYYLTMSWEETVTDIPNGSGVIYDNINYNGTIFLSSGSSNNYFTSTDGLAWTNRTLPNTIPLYVDQQRHIYANGIFMIACRHTSLSNIAAYYTSTNGISWTESVKVLPTSYQINRYPEYGGNNWVDVVRAPTSLQVLVSADNGVNWTLRNTGISTDSPSRFAYDAKYGNGKWLIVMDNSTSSVADSATSTDTITWTLTTNIHPRMLTNSGNGMYYWGNGKWLSIVKQNSTNIPKTYESNNGISWTLTDYLSGYPFSGFSSDGIKYFYDLKYHDNLDGWTFDAEWWNDVSYLTRTMYTPDGANWIYLDQPADSTANVVYSYKTTSYDNTMYQFIQTSYNPADSMLVLKGTLSYNPNNYFAIPDEYSDGNAYAGYVMKPYIKAL